MVNEWTRDDLPDATELCRMSVYNIDVMVDRNLNAIVGHLNANHPKSDTDRWRRAHEIVERERDEARERLREAETRLAKCMADFQDVEDERDEAVARAEAAEARTAPAVTKRELRSVVGAHDPGDDELAVSRVNALTDRLWSLVSGADPAVHVVRESDLPEAWRDRDGLWRAGQSSYCRVTPEDMRSVIPATLGMVAARESVARAIEAEEAEAVDPVEELAGQIESATREAIRQVCDDLADVVPSLDPLAVERAMEVTAASRKVAAHVLGQEGRHVDQ